MMKVSPNTPGASGTARKAPGATSSGVAVRISDRAPPRFWTALRRGWYQFRGVCRSRWWWASGYAARLEGEVVHLRALSADRLGRLRAACDIIERLKYPPIDKGGALLLAAGEVDMQDASHPCEAAWQEGDTGTWNCDRERADEVCWCSVAEDLRQLEAALREAEPFNRATATELY